MKIIVFVCVVFGLAVGLTSQVSAISEAQKNAIVENCATIREDLKTLQHNDSRARVYLGRYYETILNRFIIPLNMRLVENNLQSDKLASSQSDFTKLKNNFTIDYIEYQKGLEELVGVNCKNEPERFYRKLGVVREKRQVVAEDVAKMQRLMLAQVSLVEWLKEEI